MILRFFRSGPIVRLSLGLVSLLICLLLVLDLSIGLVPDRYDDAVRIRQRICESLAIQVTALLQSGEGGALRKTLADVLERDKELLSVATRRAGRPTDRRGRRSQRALVAAGQRPLIGHPGARAADGRRPAVG